MKWKPFGCLHQIKLDKTRWIISLSNKQLYDSHADVYCQRLFSVDAGALSDNPNRNLYSERSKQGGKLLLVTSFVFC